MRKTLAILAACSALALAACTSSSGTVDNDRKHTDEQLSRYQANQPVPKFDWSQYRQTAIDITSAQVHGVATTTFFFNQGTDNPVKTCPSLGFPMPSTVQVTNPQQIARSDFGAGNWVDGVVDQMEPNGTYTGDSSATYVVCVAPNGDRYVVYWEGFVYTEGGPARWDRESGTVVLTGPPSVKTTSKK